MGAELHDVAALGFDREVFVERTNVRAVRFKQDLVVAAIGNRASGGDRGDPRALGRKQTPVNAVAVQERVPALRVERDHGVEIVPREVAIGPRSAHVGEQVGFTPRLRDAGRHDLLRQDVERGSWDRRAVEGLSLDGHEQRLGLRQFVDCQRKDSTLRHARGTMTGASHTLQQSGDRARGANLDRQVDVADVDAELQGRCCDQRTELPGLESFLCVESTRPRQAAVMAGDGVLAESFGETGRQALGHLPCVDEHQRRPVLFNQRRHARVDDVPLLM